MWLFLLLWFNKKRRVSRFYRWKFYRHLQKHYTTYTFVLFWIEDELRTTVWSWIKKFITLWKI